MENAQSRSDSVCEGSNPSPAANIGGQNYTFCPPIVLSEKTTAIQAETRNLIIEDTYIDHDGVAVVVLLFYKKMENIIMSKNKSTLITAGMRKSFRDGTSKLSKRVCYGYECDEHGSLAVCEREAAVVRQIFGYYLAGASLGQIADHLAEREIPSPTGKARWGREALGKLLRNEKYVGQVRLQKTIVRDGKQVANGEVDQYIYTNNHPAIITTEAFEETQMRLLERSKEVQRSTNFEQSM